MPVLKNKTQGRYVNVSKNIVEDKSLSLKDRGLLVTLLSFPDNWHFTISGLATIIPDGKHAINASLKTLIKAGYVTKKQDRNKNGEFGGIILEVHETPRKPMTENPTTDNQLPENPETEEPVPENPEQLNNNRESNNKVNTNEVNSNKYRKPDKKNKFNNFDQRDYGDMSDLERKLLECDAR